MKIKAKRAIFLVYLVALGQVTFGQACGFFRVKYKGTIVNGADLVKEIRMPSKEYITGDVKRRRSKIMFDTFQVATTAEFNHLVLYRTCSAGMSPKHRIEQVKKNTGFIPLLIITKKNKKKYIKIPFEQIEFIEGKKGEKYVIMIDLKEIRI